MSDEEELLAKLGSRRIHTLHGPVRLVGIYGHSLVDSVIQVKIGDVVCGTFPINGSFQIRLIEFIPYVPEGSILEIDMPSRIQHCTVEYQRSDDIYKGSVTAVSKI